MIQPMMDRVLILPDEGAEFWSKEANIVKREVDRERPQEGTVLALGPDVKDSKLAVGDKVLYGKFSGSELKVDGVELVMLCEADILGRQEKAMTLEQAVLAAGATMPRPKVERILP